MSDSPIKVVFDCNVFVQALLNPVGAAGVCMQYALDGVVSLSLSPYVLAEIRDIPTKPTPMRLGITPPKVERLIANLTAVSTLIDHVPEVYEHPIDADDAHYVNLARAAGAAIIVSRDRHLLGLGDPAKPWSADFRGRFPELRVITPEEMLHMLRPTVP